MKPLILVIDDNKAIRYLLQTILSKKYRVVSAPDAASAMFFLAEKNFPALIIADPVLADTPRWSLIEHLSESAMYKHIPIIVLSDADTSEVESKCIELGVAASYRKPFNPVTLMENIDQLVAGDLETANRGSFRLV